MQELVYRTIIFAAVVLPVALWAFAIRARSLQKLHENAQVLAGERQVDRQPHERSVLERWWFSIVGPIGASAAAFSAADAYEGGNYRWTFIAFTSSGIFVWLSWLAANNSRREIISGS